MPLTNRVTLVQSDGLQMKYAGGRQQRAREKLPSLSRQLPSEGRIPGPGKPDLDKKIVAV